MQFEIEIDIDGRRFQGTPLQILKQMQALSFGPEGQTVPEYIEWMSKNAEVLGYAPLKVTGETDEELASSLVETIIARGYATMVHTATC